MRQHKATPSPARIQIAWITTELLRERPANSPIHVRPVHLQSSPGAMFSRRARQHRKPGAGAGGDLRLLFPSLVLDQRLRDGYEQHTHDWQPARRSGTQHGILGVHGFRFDLPRAIFASWEWRLEDGFLSSSFSAPMIYGRRHA